MFINNDTIPEYAKLNARISITIPTMNFGIVPDTRKTIPVNTIEILRRISIVKSIIAQRNDKHLYIFNSQKVIEINFG